jgi:hypothetical protein
MHRENFSAIPRFSRFTFWLAVSSAIPVAFGLTVVPFVPAFSDNHSEGLSQPSNIDPIYYLHIPEAGSGFATTLAHHACSGRIHDNVSVIEPREFFNEWSRVCDHTNFMRFQSGHDPLDNIDESDMQHVVMMVREPAQRILSGYYNGLQDCWYLRRKYECRTSNISDRTKCNGDTQTEHGFYMRDPNTIVPVEYGQCVENCTANMLTGRFCGDQGAVNIDRAVEVIDKVGFVGLAHEWALSVCLWHKRFGGAVLPVELANLRPGIVYKESFSKFVQYDEDMLLGEWRPTADNFVYKAAVRRFWREMQQYNVDIQACESEAWKAVDQSPVIDYPENTSFEDEFPEIAAASDQSSVMDYPENYSFGDNFSETAAASENGRLEAGVASDSVSESVPELMSIDPIYYLHVPKAGASFATTIVHHVCGSDIPSDVWVQEPLKFVETWANHCDESRFGRFNTSIQPLDETILGNGLEHVVMVARDPAQRILSSYHDDLYGCWDLHTKYNCTPSSESSPSICNGDTKSADGRIWRNTDIISPLEYGKCVANCTANLLTGRPCGESSWPDTTLAVRNIDKLGFVGLMDEPRLSVCLWHKMFGGKVLPVEFMNSKPGGDMVPEVRYDDDALLGHWRPANDMRVFMAATRRFWRDVERFSVDRDACDTTFNTLLQVPK